VNFASIPSGVAAVDVNLDGLLDFAYFGDMLGQMWRLDLRDLSVASTPTDRWSSKLRKGDGTTALTPFLVFQAPQPVGGSTQYFPIYYQPAVVSLASTVPGQPFVGLAFGTGDRDDITATCDATTRSTSYNQRFYFVQDKGNTQTLTESSAGMMKIATSSTANTTTIPTAGWYMLMGTSGATAAERQITDILVVNQFIYFFTQTPVASGAGGSGTCPPPSTCSATGGTPRQYTMFYANGNYPPGATDRGAAVPDATFATNPVFYISADQQGNIAFTTNHGGFSQNTNVQPTQSNVKAWKER
jgi:type IV pilus assembly protein PilY1